jgi:predicted NBD/HSP70 family sugar kinase
LVLSLIRRHGSLPKAEIARLTGLSAQTISVIMRQLESDALVIREAPLRGRVGQPSVPYSLNKDGAYSVGLKIGRRSSELVLMDFAGNVIDWRRATYRYPTADASTAFLRENFASILSECDRDLTGLISGLGVAIPFKLWSWADQIGAPQGTMESWKQFEIEAVFGEVCALPVYVCNDATAACGAELIFGRGAELTDYLYFFVGTFIGGGIVLDGRLYPGKRANAGAIGSILIPDADQQNGGARQLLQSASIYILEQRLAACGRDASELWRPDSDWFALGFLFDDWLAEVAQGLAYAIVSATSVVDFENILIDGTFPAPVRERLIAQTELALQKTDCTGLLPIVLGEGSLGGPARAMGAASLPLMANFTRDSEVLFKDVADEAAG